ncbi:hypothetical protein ACVNF4_16960 [Streptomyces sp. S6]
MSDLRTALAVHLPDQAGVLTTVAEADERGVEVVVGGVDGRPCAGVDVRAVGIGEST